MATELVMPRLSDTMDTGTIGKWLKQVGDQVKKGDIIAEIETDKANMEMEAFANGILAKQMVAEGESVAVGEPIAVIAGSEEEAKSIQSGADGAGPKPSAASSDGASAPTAVAPAEADSQPSDQPPAAAAQQPDADAGGRLKASPLARRIAQERGIDLREVSGTGPGGRITKEDVQAFVTQAGSERPAQQPAATPSPAQAPSQPQPQAQPTGAAGLRGAQPVEMTRMQQTIARRMVESKFTAPEFVLTAEVDMTEARALLAGFKVIEGAPKIGPNDLLVKATSAALQHHPEVNAGWENNGMVRYGRVNIGVAVAIEGGLIVPVIQDADKKSLGQIAQESKALIEKARSNKLAPSDYEGGTFTISNLGMYGIEQFTPIINAPEACIMGVGSIVQKPIVVNGEVAIRDRMRVTLSCDHRVVNGSQGAEFLQTLRRTLEKPMLALL